LPEVWRDIWSCGGVKASRFFQTLVLGPFSKNFERGPCLKVRPRRMVRFSSVPPARATARYELDVERGLRIERYQGLVGLEDLRSVALIAAADPDWSADFNALVDFADATLELSVNDVLRIAIAWRQPSYRSDGWTAFVVGSGAGSNYGLVRMLSTWARMSERMGVFARRDQAEEWLAAKARPPVAAAMLAKVG
jgi:hypothetical protein